MAIAAWLNRLGLGRYEAAFVENSIDTDILPDLTDRDLIELGVTLGDRKRLLKAIANLSNGAGAPAANQLHAPPRPAEEAERRPITVMFCDLVGSTSLAAKLDVEDWRELVSAYLDEASTAVTGFGGHVLKKLGDGIMALFGYPRAQENDAERAVRAGLAILRALEDLNARNVARGLPALAARIGLESGPVVVDATGEVYGDAPNVAARVQSAAEPGTLLVTAAVRSQVAGLFVAEDRGAHELKGVAGRPTLYRLLRASGGGRRGGARSLTLLVGREEELAALERRWERAKAGDGQFVQIVGEPGLGKSRLTEELRARLAAAPHTWVAWSSSQLLQNTPLHPIAEWGRQRFSGAEIAPEKRLAELETALAQVELDPAEYAPLLAPLLDMTMSEANTPKLAPEELRRRQLAAIAAWLLAGARQQAVVLAFEDLHWADPTTLDLLRTLAERGAQAPLLIVATTRPEFRAPWATRPHHSVISLSPLNRAEVVRMVGGIAERHALSKGAIENVADRAGGVPLFAEEVTWLLLEGGAQTIPPTLGQLLAARLDRLGEAREVAQIGAVLGGVFGHELLAAVANLPAPTLEAALEKLADADLLFVDGVAPTATYHFKHALIRDAAYESLLRSRRQALHRRAGQTLAAASEPPAELVAHHFTQAGDREIAIDWWGKAGDAALKRSAFQEATSHLGRAIAMTDADRREKDSPSAGTDAATPAERAAPDANGADRAIRANYARAVLWAAGPTAYDTKVAFDLAASRQEDNASGEERTIRFYGVYTRALLVGDVRVARALTEREMGSLEETPDGPKRGWLQCCRGTACYFLGDLPTATSALEYALAKFPLDESVGMRRFGVVDIAVLTAANLSNAYWVTGRFDEARVLSRGSVERSAGADELSRMLSAYFLAMLERRRGDIASVVTASDLLLAAAGAAGIRQYENVGTLWRGWAKCRLGDGAADLSEVNDACERLLEARTNLGLPCMFGLIAEIEITAGKPEEALNRIDAGLKLAAESGEAVDLPYLHRLKGEVLWKAFPNTPSRAEIEFQTAFSFADRMGQRSEALVTALVFARFAQEFGRPADARERLAASLDGLEPTREFPAYLEAQALLEKLASEGIVGPCHDI